MAFIKLLRLLGFEQAVEILADTGEMNEPAAMHIPFATEHYRFDFSLVDQVVEGAALDPEQALHIPPPPKFGEWGSICRTCYADLVCCHVFHS